MQLLREIRVASASGTLNEGIDLGNVVAGGVVCTFQTGLATTQLEIKSFLDLAPTSYIVCRPYGGYSIGWTFGGPFLGNVFVATTSGADSMFGIIRIYDEPIAPFGRVPLINIEIAALGAGATSATFGADISQPWVRTFSAEINAAEAHHVDYRLVQLSLTGAWEIGSNLAAGIPYTESGIQTVPGIHRDYRVVNDGAIPSVVRGHVMGICGGAV